jgi:hypothetical protein
VTATCVRRDLNSTRWLTDAIWARRTKLEDVFINDVTEIEDDHLPFLEAGIPAVDIIDLGATPAHADGHHRAAQCPQPAVGG